MGNKSQKEVMASELDTLEKVIGHYAPGIEPRRELDWLSQQLPGVVRPRKEEKPIDFPDIVRPVTEPAKKKHEKYTKKEIFGSKECQEYYINAVTEALENNPDGLYRFILAHQSYKDKKDWIKWNKDFAAMLGITVDPKYKGANELITNRRLAAAGQHFLINKYREDVFQITFSRKRMSPWIFADGLTGPYSVSVYSEYWNAVHGPKNPDKDRTTRAGLGGGYDNKEKAKETYKGAMNYLDVQTGKSQPKKKDEGREAKEPAPQNDDEKAIARYKKLDKASSTAVKPEDLMIKNYTVGKELSLSRVLADCYKETDLRNSENSPKTFRMLNLLAQQIGARIETIRVQSADIINLGEDGVFTITKPDGTNREAIDIKRSKI